jgi:hypothetical protein
MSNWISIAAVSDTLRNLLTNVFGNLNDSVIGNVSVTTHPPDKARANNSGNQINLFLYNVTHNAALRNTSLPGQLRPGESGITPIAFDLHYLLTAYGNDNDDILGSRILGKAASALNDHPILSADDITYAGNDLNNQIDRIRITPQNITVEAMSQLWMIFQTQYRISVGYQVGVVIIDSAAPVKIPPPVLNRGKDNRGAKTSTGLSAVLQEIVLPHNLPSCEVDGEIILQGDNVDIDSEIHFENRHQHLLDKDLNIEAIVKKPEPNSTPGNIVVRLDDPSGWSAGLYTVYVKIPSSDGTSIATNELPLSIAPKITLTNITLSDATAPSPGSPILRNVHLVVTVAPKILSGQKVYLLFGSKQQVWDLSPRPKTTDTVEFQINDVELGTYLVRLRVDGVDSMPFDLSSEPLSFDDNQKVVVN